jgi:hypothetical protein
MNHGTAIKLSALAVLVASVGAAQTASLDLSSGSGAPGTVVTLNLSLTSTVDQPAAIQWTASYAPKDISSVSVTAGSGTTASIQCNNTPGTSTCVVWAINSNTITDGVVATVALTIAGSTTDSSSVIQLSNGDAASLEGFAVPTSTTGSALTLNIAPPAPVIGSANTAGGTVGSALSYQIAATNSPTGYGATGLPTGLSVNTANGLISGTPTAAGISTVALSATNSGGTGNATLTLTIGPPAPAISSANTANGTVGSAFSYQITATNSSTGYGATGLPTGLSVNTDTGLISGTPTAAGISTVALSATNGGGTGKANLTLTIAAGLPVITSATTTSGTVGSVVSYQITATNSPTSYGATGLPTGLSLNTVSGLISGTPAAAGTSKVALSATNGGGTGHATLTLKVIASSTPISFVQAAANASSGGVRSLSVSFPSSSVAGDFILVAFDFDTNATVSSVSDSQGNAFIKVGNQLTSPGGARSRVYYAKNIKGGADTVKIALSANSGWLEVYLTEYSGVDHTNPIDAQAGTSGSAGPVSSGHGVTDFAGDLIYGYCVGDSACTAGSGFAARSTLNDNLIEDMTAGGPGTYSATGSANNGWTMHMVALKPAR